MLSSDSSSTLDHESLGVTWVTSIISSEVLHLIMPTGLPNQNLNNIFAKQRMIILNKQKQKIPLFHSFLIFSPASCWFQCEKITALLIKEWISFNSRFIHERLSIMKKAYFFLYRIYHVSFNILEFQSFNNIYATFMWPILISPYYG